MEFLFDVNIVLPDSITVISSSNVTDYNSLHFSPNNNRQNQYYEHLGKIIDEMGVASGKAQKLHVAVTSFLKFKCSDQHLYLMKDCNSVAGLLKVGVKQLFLCDERDVLHECRPLCVLDFYIHETKQRSGYGKKLFQQMLENEKVSVHQLAIDRPSQKMLAFLAKHFGLKNPIYQINKYVVFRDFFLDLAVKKESDKNRRKSAPPLGNYAGTSKETHHQTAASSFFHGSNSLKADVDAKKFWYQSNESVVLRKNDFIPNKKYNNKDIFQQRTYSRHSFGENEVGLKKPRQMLSESSSLLESRIKSHDLHDDRSTSVGVTPVDSPGTNQTKKNEYVNAEGNYSISAILSNNKISQNEFGTSWNILGVPSKNYTYKSQFK